MIDPILSLAFTLHSNKGCYAVLLGSGVSRSAQIPTGWEVTLELVRKVAHMQGANCEPDPAAWYRDKHGSEPQYSVLVDELAKSPTERQQLLKPYFEPNEEERRQGIKSPTVAHRAVASLVQRGYIRVVVTTNFDRLMERALEGLGVTPTVIATPDAVRGALPLAYSPCTVIKVHGDYLDTRIRNSPSELAQYDPDTNQLLDRVFDEHGLMVCGWSAEYDTALRDALSRCRSHRFTTYWTAIGELHSLAQQLVSQRKAQLLNISGADQFFSMLNEKVTSLEEFDRPHPLSLQSAVSTLKRYLVDDCHRVRLQEMVTEEIEKAREVIMDPGFLYDPAYGETAGVKKRLLKYEATMEIPIHLMVHGCYWGKSECFGLWIRSLDRMGNAVIEQARRYPTGCDLLLYPALLLLYGGGIAAVAIENYELFKGLLIDARIRQGAREEPAVSLFDLLVHYERYFDRVPEWSGCQFRVSNRLHSVLREPFRSIEPDDVRFGQLFDRFEYLAALTQGWLSKGKTMNVGRFARLYHDPPYAAIVGRIAAEQEKTGADWKPLQAGLFDGDQQTFLRLKAELDKKIHDHNFVSE